MKDHRINKEESHSEATLTGCSLRLYTGPHVLCMHPSAGQLTMM